MFAEVTINDFKSKSQPYCIIFAYPKGSEPIVYKGMAEDVERHVCETWPNVLMNVTYWRNGTSRNIWYLVIDGKKHMFVKSRYFDDVSCKYVAFINGTKLTFKRVPKKWIDKFTHIEYLDSYESLPADVRSRLSLEQFVKTLGG